MGTKTFVWARPEQAGLIRRVADHADLEIVGVGLAAPDNGDVRAALPGIEITDDWRAGISSSHAQTALLLTRDAPGPGGIEPIPGPDLASLAEASGIRVLSLEPIPGELRETADTREEHLARVRMIPLFVRAPRFADMLELAEALAPDRTLHVAFRCGRGEGSLAARLFDALALAHRLLGTPENVDACVIAPGSRGGLRPAPPESLLGLRGDMTLNLRYAAPTAASIALSDRAGRWFRGVTLIAEGGALRVSDDALEHLSPEGEVLDRSMGDAPLHDDPRGPAASILADSLRRVGDARSAPEMPVPVDTVLAIAEAALLSARTGQPESPSMMRRIVGAT